MVDIKNIANELTKKSEDNSDYIKFEVGVIPGEVEVVQILVEDREELPIFISNTDGEILCMSYLFKAEELKSDVTAEIDSAMLSMNIAMPLSSFGKIDGQYVVFGSLSAKSDIDTLVHEIEILSDNTLEAIDAMKDYLK